jgi:hypothetical protein
MTPPALLRARWAALRYGPLLALAARSRRAGRHVAAAIAAVELGIDRARRETAGQRIARWLDLSPAEARRVFRASLTSEAQEEADSAYFMGHPHALVPAFVRAGEPPHRGGTIYATFHFGSPVLTYLYLRVGRALDVVAVERKLTATNPMAAPKRRWGARKVAWVERFTGRPMLDVDAATMARARERLLDGGALYAAVDVPGDVVGRAATATLLGERIRVSSGVTTLARLARAPLQPVVAISRADRFDLHYGTPIEPGPEAQTLAALMEALATLLRSFPGEWWLWPYVTPARE